MKRSVVVAEECKSNGDGDGDIQRKVARYECKTELPSLTETPVNFLHLILSKHRDIKWTKYEKENLDCDYTQLFTRCEAIHLFQAFEQELDYYTGDLTKVFVYGKWHQIPRKQVAYGDAGVSYKFSGTTVPARPWASNPLVSALRRCVSAASGWQYNLVLINRYADGNDSIGEHKDDEADLVPTAPIASLSLGATREFVLRHEEMRARGGKDAGTDRDIAQLTIPLEAGSLLLINPPTNTHWYHSLPKRKRVREARINFTFRVMSESAWRGGTNKDGCGPCEDVAAGSLQS